MRRLHCSEAVVGEVDADDEVGELGDDVAVEDDVDPAPEEELVEAPGVVVVVALVSAVDVLGEGSVVDTAPPVVVVSEGATATGVSPT